MEEIQRGIGGIMMKAQMTNKQALQYTVKEIETMLGNIKKEINSGNFTVAAEGLQYVQEWARTAQIQCGKCVEEE
jgi:hypothetical protein